MTDEQIVELVNKSANETKDLLFAYIAEAEIKLQALENILYKKKVFVSREELENEYHSLAKSRLTTVITAYDSLLPKNRNIMNIFRASKK